MRKILAIVAVGVLAAVACWVPGSMLLPSADNQAAMTEPLSLLLFAAGLVAARRKRTRRMVRQQARARRTYAPAWRAVAASPAT